MSMTHTILNVFVGVPYKQVTFWNKKDVEMVLNFC